MFYINNQFFVFVCNQLVQPKCSQKDVTKALDFFGDSEKTVLEKTTYAEDRLSTEGNMQFADQLQTQYAVDLTAK